MKDEAEQSTPRGSRADDDVIIFILLAVLFFTISG